MERERNTSTLNIFIVGNPYNKVANEEVSTLLREITGSIVSRELKLVDDFTSAELCIVLDIVPKDLAKFAKDKKVILITAQNRNKQSLNTYLKECEQKTQADWKNVKVVNINSENESRLVQKWWNLNTAVFSIAENY